MSKRINELVALARDSGVIHGEKFNLRNEARLERLHEREDQLVQQLGAARDALEADLAELIDRAQGLADKARQYSGCDLFDQADALDAAVTRLLNGGEG